MQNYNQRYKALNLAIDNPVAVIANYVAYKKIEKTVYIAGQLPWLNRTIIQGKIGHNASLQQGIDAARLCAQQIIYQLNLACQEDLNLVKECISLKGYVNCTPEFTQISEVINGASDLIVEIFGEAGRHSRIAVGVNSLPKGSLVEVEAVFYLNPNY